MTDTTDLAKELRAAVKRIDALEKRIADLEGDVGDGMGERCPSCGKFTFFVTNSQPMAGPFVTRTYTCKSCEFSEDQTITPK